MSSPDGQFHVIFNGEIYNYIELRRELQGKGQFRTGTDTEVLIAAYRQWGKGCLHRLVGMFSFAVWDEREQKLFAARDRFGVKPLFYHESPGGGLWLASEIKALHEAGVPREPDDGVWADFLVRGLYDHKENTFWRGVQRVLPGHCLEWSAGGGIRRYPWYDLAGRVLEAGADARGEDEVGEELLALLEESVRLRFRADVDVGVCLSGGLDSSLLFGLIHRIHGAGSRTKAFTYVCGDERYDETPWVEQMLEGTDHPYFPCLLRAAEVPQLAEEVQRSQDEPFGGLPTIAMSKVHERARAEGVTVLLDGNGMDEGWAGYEYYARAGEVEASLGPVQGSRSPSTRPDCLVPEFAAKAAPFDPPKPFGDSLLDLQYRDICCAKIPRAMRFADRVSMMHSRELREPFLDHRILELGLRQPEERKIRDGQGKWLPRRVAVTLLPRGVREAPKRPVQTPQREWLRGPLSAWASDCIEEALRGFGAGWLEGKLLRRAWQEYLEEGADNSFPVWQWVNLGIMARR